MKVFTCSEVSQNFEKILIFAQSEEIEIHRRDGVVFSLQSKNIRKSPFDVQGIKTQATTQDILDAVQDSRTR